MGNSDVLSILHPMESLRAQWYIKSQHFIGNLIGYEHDKSMTNILKDKGWIMSESAGLDEENMDFSMMKTSFVLTEQGKKHIPEIVEMYWE